MRISSQARRTSVVLLGLLLVSGTPVVAQTAAEPLQPVRLAVTSAQPSPQPLGTTVWFEAVATGNDAPYEFRWAIWNGRDWSVTAWSASNRLAWLPVTANSGYQVQAQARRAGSASGNAEALATVPYAVHPVVNRLRVRADKPSPQRAGTPITFVADVQGSAAPREYRWMLWDGRRYLPLTDYGAAERFTWTPDAANAAYEVQVRVRGAGTSVSYESVAGLRFAIEPPPHVEGSAGSR